LLAFSSVISLNIPPDTVLNYYYSFTVSTANLVIHHTEPALFSKPVKIMALVSSDIGNSPGC
jgi:hypothetical protein